MRIASVFALVAGCALVSACAETQKTDERFSQSTEYDAVLQGEHAASWKKISREPSAISTPSPTGAAAAKVP